MIDTRVFYFVLEDRDITAGAPGHVQWTGLSAFHSPEALETLGEGWVPVSHAITPMDGGKVVLSVMANREVNAPA